MRLLKLGIAFAFALTCTLACAQGEHEVKNLPVNNAQLITENAGSGKVTGELDNTSGVTLSTAIVTYAILDSQGNQVATASAIAQGVAPNSAWKFAALYSGATGNVSTARLAKIMAVADQ